VSCKEEIHADGLQDESRTIIPAENTGWVAGFSALSHVRGATDALRRGRPAISPISHAER